MRRLLVLLSVPPHDCGLVIYCACRDGTCTTGGCGSSTCDVVCTGHGGGTSAACSPTDGG